MPTGKAVKWFLLALGFLQASTFCRAATIQVTPIDNAEQALVTVAGPFEFADIEQFRTKTSMLSKAVVMFGSPGGNLLAGIEIGTQIRLKGFASLVPEGSSCASACALAWLGGTKRFMGPDAHVGFHAAFVVIDGVSKETSVGNARVGAYLNRIGLPDRAVDYITSAAPNNMSWLTLTDASNLGIDVELFQPNPTPVPTTSPPITPPNESVASPSPNGRYEVTNCGAIVDAKTGLVWVIGPARNISFPQAENWARQYRSCPGGWRLPTLRQLDALYDRSQTAGIGYFTHGKRWPAHIDPIFSKIGEGSWAWAGDIVGDGTSVQEAFAYNFNQGTQTIILKNGFEGTIRVMAVSTAVAGPAAAVRRFYEALETANGEEAAKSILPEKRMGPFSPEAMTTYYGSLSKPLRLLAIDSNGNRTLVQYQFRSRTRGQCDGQAEVWTVEWQGTTYIEKIKALKGC